MSWNNEIKNHSFKWFSQYGEEGYLSFIFRNIGTANKYFVEFGAGDGFWLSNTRFFKKLGWEGLMMDGREATEDVRNEWITRENIVELFKKYDVPESFDFLSIDIDGNDFWVLDEILRYYKPRVVVAEFNSGLDNIAMTMPYNPNHKWDGSYHFGMSLAGAKWLAEKHNYSVIFQNDNVNCYLVRNELLQGVEIPEITYEQVKSFPIVEKAEWVYL